MAKKDIDLVMALGMPEGGKMGDKGKGGSGYLAGKPPKLRAYLMDAVDSRLSHEERAEALCRAMDEFAGDEEAEEGDEENGDYELPEGTPAEY